MTRESHGGIDHHRPGCTQRRCQQSDNTVGEDRGVCGVHLDLLELFVDLAAGVSPRQWQAAAGEGVKNKDVNHTSVGRLAWSRVVHITSRSRKCGMCPGPAPLASPDTGEVTSGAERGETSAHAGTPSSGLSTSASR